ncbi:hypothetical protein ACFOY8_12925 [Thalassospira xianhensis]|uniref:Uncharacterized protein n=2 Tax=Thalassospira TaxID=168934 RepID=A0A285TT94_9PROT|nr:MULTISPECIES: hypothetical protein [Thalassospira]RCK07875.1 hypothetical protein TH5_02365 [Thalassospira xianhensis MCCC 1A02616]SOC27304.1 hypothetical protein SAMN05428964_105360 [Thalassospira xiamenensis]
MSTGKTKPPPSRLNKKQIIAFLEPEQIEVITKKISQEGKTGQEVLGEAINAVFALHGMPPVIKYGHLRLVRRQKSRAQSRAQSTAPSCRKGRVAFGGWFHKDTHAKIAAFAAELDLTFQTIVEKGISMITDPKPAEEQEEAEVRDVA